MSRWKAAGFHLLISFCVAVLAAVVIYLVWYPPPYFRVAGDSSLMVLIISVDVVIGPLLTLAVFKSGKKGLRFDIAVIGILQLVAFIYGMSTIARARPVFVVAEVDRFVAIAANSIDKADLAAGQSPEFRSFSWTGPRLVGSVVPTMASTGGKEPDKLPKYYVPYSQVSSTMLAHSKPLATTMKKSTTAAALVTAFLSKHGGQATDYRTLPLSGHTDEFTMIVLASNGQPQAALPINPW